MTIREYFNLYDIKIYLKEELEKEYEQSKGFVNNPIEKLKGMIATLDKILTEAKED